MKHLTRKTFIFFCIFFYSSATFATCDSIGCYTTIEKLYISGESDGSIYILPNEDDLQKVNCTPKEGTYFTLKYDHKLHSEMYSALLAAKMAEKEVRLRILEESKICELVYVMIL